MNTKPFKYNFRVVKADNTKFGDVKAEFESHGVKYDTELENGQVVSIKRSSVTHELPVPAVTDFSEGFVQSLIEDQLYEAVRKEFVDKYKTVDTSLITADWIEQALAAKRAAAIDGEAIKGFAALIERQLKAAGKGEGTIGIVCELIKGKFGKRVLNSYSKYKEQFLDISMLLAGILQDLPESESSEYFPVLELLTNNLEKFLETDEEETIELDLL